MPLIKEFYHFNLIFEYFKYILMIWKNYLTLKENLIPLESFIALLRFNLN
jgi:hypothetical protein